MSKKEEEEELKIELKGKIEYRRNRVLSGHAPHKLIKLEMQKYLKNVKEEIKDIFAIDRFKWKGLHKVE